MGDLRARRRRRAAEQCGDAISAARGSDVHCALEVAATICSAPPRRSSVARRKRYEPCCRSTSQSRSITSWRYGASICSRRLAPRPHRCRPDRCAILPRRDLVENGLDERGLDSPDRLPSRLPAGRAAARRSPRARRPVEAVEAQVVVEKAGNRALEAVELGERVLAQREQDVDRRPGRVSSAASRARSVRASGVVEEVLLRPGREAGRSRPEPSTRPRPCRRASRRADSRRGGDGPATARPGRRDQRRKRRRRPDRSGSSRSRRATAAARASTCRRRSGRTAPSAREATTFAQTISTLPLAAEEERRVDLRVVERRQALVGATRQRSRSWARMPTSRPEQDGERVLVDLEASTSSRAPERALERCRRRRIAHERVAGRHARPGAG